jgi:CHAD domain-containing protein
VATRRSRALIRASRPLIRDQLATLDRELRWLGGLTGPTRDLDVMIGHLRELTEDLGPDQAGATLVIAALERDRLGTREELVRALDSERFGALLERFSAALPELVAVNRGVDLARLARRELERVREAYEALGLDPSDEELHALRIKAKHARYAAELAASAGGHALTELAQAITELQDVLGTHQDAVVAERRVRALVSEDSALAVGRIVERERLRRGLARARVPAAWERIERLAAQVF